MKKVYVLLFLVANITINAQNITKNIILITIDGLRWEEVFNGADQVFISKKKYVTNKELVKNKYWDSDHVKRRNMLMPFMWNQISGNGQIYGNRNIGCSVNVKNAYNISYPGYNEILCGFVDDRINENNVTPNPNLTLLDFINKHPDFGGKVAVFSTWNAFADIVNRNRNGIIVNAGLEPLDIHNGSQTTHLLNKLQTQLPDAFFGKRSDAITFNLALEYLKQERPRFLYIAFDETDHFGHEGSYDQYLNAASNSDSFIREIWEWVQSDADYKNNTTLFIATDHGRGKKSEWERHNKKVKGADQTWFAVIGPDTPAKGEVSTGQYYNDQFAKTIAGLLNLNYVSEKPVGDSIGQVVGK